MIRKLFIRFLLGRNKEYLDLIKINGITYKVVIKPFVPPPELKPWEGCFRK